jgi:hypothetical protein
MSLVQWWQSNHLVAYELVHSPTLHIHLGLLQAHVSPFNPFSGQHSLIVGWIKQKKKKEKTNKHKHKEETKTKKTGIEKTIKKKKNSIEMHENKKAK